jgi:hypothetical protein
MAPSQRGIGLNVRSLRMACPSPRGFNLSGPNAVAVDHFAGLKKIKLCKVIASLMLINFFQEFSLVVD